MTRPASVHAAVALTLLLVVLGWTFFGLGSVFRPESELLPGILRTAGSYTLLAPVVVFGALRQNRWAMRGGLVLIVLASLPAKAVIGVVLGCVSLGLSFRATARTWLNGSSPVAPALGA
jgi:hypothetical protein